MPLNTNERLQEAFSLALEDRSSGLQDLVSNSNVILSIMRQDGNWKAFEGPTIRERILYNESGTYVRYSGYQFLNPQPAELVNDAEFTPKLAAVSVVLSGEDILKNSGSRAQLMNIFEVHIDAAMQELDDRFTEDLHSAGTASGGLQIGGLQLAIPTTVDSGTYGGISRVNNSQWRTTTYDANSFYSGYTAVTSVSVKPMLTRIVIARSRGKVGPNIILMSSEHYEAYQAATEAIQRITDAGGVGKLGFPSLKFYGAGKSIDVVLEGGIGSAMPSNTTYLIDMRTMRFRYHPDRNFVKFGGKQMPVNQDAMVQHIGFYGELTMASPIHNAKLYDSSP